MVYLFAMSILSIILINALAYYFNAQKAFINVSQEYTAIGSAENKYYVLSKDNYDAVYDKENNLSESLKYSPWSYNISVNDTPKYVVNNKFGKYKESKIDMINSLNSNQSFSLYAETMNKEAGYTGVFDIENGWTKLPNGLILQWGRKYIHQIEDSDNTGEYVYISFPQKCLNVVAGLYTQHASGGDAYVIYIQNMSENSAVIVNDSSYYDYPHGYVYWQAIGY